MTTNDVIVAHDRSELHLKIAELGPATVLIEGNREALAFLSQLLAAHAEGSSCGLQMSPDGAGSKWFSRDSTKGLYIHCTDTCHAPHRLE